MGADSTLQLVIQVDRAPRQLAKPLDPAYERGVGVG